MKFLKLTPNNFLLYATKNYENSQLVGVDEFNEDIKIFSYVKRLLRKYHKKGTLKERLILNHITILTNIFGNMPTARMLFFYCDTNTHSQLKTFLSYLNILPKNVPEVNIKSISFDDYIVEILKGI